MVNIVCEIPASWIRFLSLIDILFPTQGFASLLAGMLIFLTVDIIQGHRQVPIARLHSWPPSAFSSLSACDLACESLGKHFKGWLIKSFWDWMVSLAISLMYRLPALLRSYIRFTLRPCSAGFGRRSSLILGLVISITISFLVLLWDYNHFLICARHVHCLETFLGLIPLCLISMLHFLCYWTELFIFIWFQGRISSSASDDGLSIVSVQCFLSSWSPLSLFPGLLLLLRDVTVLVLRRFLATYVFVWHFQQMIEGISCYLFFWP